MLVQVFYRQRDSDASPASEAIERGAELSSWVASVTILIIIPYACVHLPYPLVTAHSLASAFSIALGSHSLIFSSLLW